MVFTAGYATATVLITMDEERWRVSLSDVLIVPVVWALSVVFMPITLTTLSLSYAKKFLKAITS